MTEIDICLIFAPDSCTDLGHPVRLHYQKLPSRRVPLSLRCVALAWLDSGLIVLRSSINMCAKLRTTESKTWASAMQTVWALHLWESLTAQFLWHSFDHEIRTTLSLRRRIYPELLTTRRPEQRPRRPRMIHGRSSALCCCCKRSLIASYSMRPTRDHRCDLGTYWVGFRRRMGYRLWRDCFCLARSLNERWYEGGWVWPFRVCNWYLFRHWCKELL